jgi:benzoyl-CoA 2,3-dioxygenase component B
MVYLLHRYFGRDGRDEAEEMLARRSGNPDKPRILQAFNQPCEDWLSFFAFTHFIDRDGKYQLAALAESGFAPLRRSTRFMLTEEAHHLFVGETGLGRIVRRTAQLMREAKNGDVREVGGIPLDLIQRYINFWFSYGLDLFGGEISSNTSDWFAAGLKGRFKEGDKYEDHQMLDASYTLEVVENERLARQQVPYRNALNEVLRDEYVKDCERALASWNRAIAEEGVDAQLSLPSRRFHRHVGLYAENWFDRAGNLILEEQAWDRERTAALPTEEDRTYVKSLMVPVVEPGAFAHWIAPPLKGINGQPLDFPYVKFVRN